MPTYEYICSKCDGTFDLVQSITEKPITTCPKERCQQPKWGKGKVKRAITGGGGSFSKGAAFIRRTIEARAYKEAAKKEAPLRQLRVRKTSGPENGVLHLQTCGGQKLVCCLPMPMKPGRGCPTDRARVLRIETHPFAAASHANAMRTRFYLSALLMGATAWAPSSFLRLATHKASLCTTCEAKRCRLRMPRSRKGSDSSNSISTNWCSRRNASNARCAGIWISASGWGRIHLVLVSASKSNKTSSSSQLFSRTAGSTGGNSDQVEDIKLIRGIVEALLLELANRATFKSAEIPVVDRGPRGPPKELDDGSGFDRSIRSAGSMVRSIRNLRGWDTLFEARSVLKSLPLQHCRSWGIQS